VRELRTSPSSGGDDDATVYERGVESAVVGECPPHPSGTEIGAGGGAVVPVQIGVVEPVGTLDQKIAQLQAELAILEQAREILAR